MVIAKTRELAEYVRPLRLTKAKNGTAFAGSETQQLLKPSSATTATATQQEATHLLLGWELIDTPSSSSSLPRSIVTHAVIGSEAAGMHSLPPELLLEIFTRLDAKALCALAQVSSSARSFADDDDVWCRSLAGHSKAAERASFLHAAQLRAERLEAEARWRRARWRRLRRRMIGVLQAICGVALVLLPLFALLRRGDRSDRTPLTDHAAVHTPLERAKPSSSSTVSRAHRPSQIGEIVWTAAAQCTSGGGGRAAGSAS